MNHDPMTSVSNLVKQYRKRLTNVLKIQIMCVVHARVLVSRICVAEDEESAALWNGQDLLLEAKVRQSLRTGF